MIIRELYINGQPVEIDDDTVIGINFTPFDIKEPVAQKVKVSNSFTIPATNSNLEKIGFPNNLQSDSTAVYDKLSSTYICGGVEFFKNTPIFISGIKGDRIECTLAEKLTIFDTLKLARWNDFFPYVLQHIYDNYNVPIVGHEETDQEANFTDVISQYITSESPVRILANIANLENPQADVNTARTVYLTASNESSYIYTDTTPLPEQAQAWNRVDAKYFIKTKIILEAIESVFGCDFNVSKNFFGNAFYYSRFVNSYFHEPNLWLKFSGVNIAPQYNYGFTYEAATYPPTDGYLFKQDKSVFDFLLSLIKTFNLLFDEDVNYQTGEESLKFYRFDTLASDAPVIDWSNSFSEVKSFEPQFENYGQKSYIKYKSVYDGGSETEGAKEIQCYNKNITAVSELLSIEGHCLGSFQNYLDWPVYVGDSKCFNNFTFFEVDEETDYTGITLKIRDINSYQYALTFPFYTFTPNEYISDSDLVLQGASQITPSDTYEFLQEVAYYPKYFKIKAWLNNHRLKDFKQYRLVYFKQLGGAFLISKIKGANIGESNDATDLELIFVNYRLPLNPPDVPYYVDESENPYTDESGNYYFDIGS